MYLLIALALILFVQFVDRALKWRTLSTKLDIAITYWALEVIMLDPAIRDARLSYFAEGNWYSKYGGGVFLPEPAVMKNEGQKIYFELLGEVYKEVVKDIEVSEEREDLCYPPNHCVSGKALKRIKQVYKELGREFNEDEYWEWGSTYHGSPA